MLNYLKKKYNRKVSKKYIYKSHSKVANRRLRIAGRFVTKQQAFEILGLAPEELLDNLMIQQLLNKHNEDQNRVDTTVKNDLGGQTIVVNNFQALLDANYDTS